MRAMTFARRTAKEILRDPLTLFFGLGFPVVLLLLLIAGDSREEQNTALLTLALYLFL